METNKAELNWLSQIRSLLKELNLRNENLGYEREARNIHVPEIIRVYTEKLRNEDILRMEKSTYNPVYKTLFREEQEPYLYSRNKIEKIRLIAQLKIGSG